MSFSDYDITQCYATNYIDLCIKNPKTQHNYCNRWEEKYKNALEKADADEIGLWTIRQNKAIWQMYSSATLMTEAKLHYNNNCFISFYFCLYYSLFNAMNAFLYMDTNLTLEQIYRISHEKLKKSFNESFCGEKGMFKEDTIELFEKLKDMREFYSYNAPMNLVFNNIKEDIETTERAIRSIYQAISLHFIIAGAVSPRYMFADIKGKEGFLLQFNKFFSNVDVVKLADDMKKLDRDYSQKRFSMCLLEIEAKKATDEYKKDNSDENRQKMVDLKGEIKNLRHEMDEDNKNLAKVQKDLEKVKLDEAATNLKNEITHGYASIGIFPIQPEVDHIFDEFHGYDNLEDNEPQSYDYTEPARYIYDSLM